MFTVVRPRIDHALPLAPQPERIALTSTSHRRVADQAGQRVRPGAVTLFLRWFALLCVPAIVASATSFVSAMDGSGNLTPVERSVEWLRGHHFGNVVSWVETQYYARHQPPTGGTLTGGLPEAATNEPTPSSPATGPASVDSIDPAATQPVAGEGVWQAYGDTSGGSTGMQVAYLRPDAVHGSVLAGVVRIDQQRTLLRLVPGSQEPGHGPWPAGNSVAAGDRPDLLAAFNSGFRVGDARGGFEEGGRTVGTLRTGAASLLIRPDGTADVVAWTSDLTTTQQPVAVRQNLDLIVDNGVPVDGLADNAGNRWGRTVGNRLFVWRSGVGIDASGRLIYVASSGLSVTTLALLLQRAGAVRAMELDINQSWVSFNVFHHDSSGIHGDKLLAAMAKPASRYLSADARDFFAVVARQPLDAPPSG
ncbi:MAG: hypothetical protein JWM12_1568 [Ilumatobacteraceae bacterium]|nr:hypothetical protein [Ilumatobacteraceae bacterium]